MIIFGTIQGRVTCCNFAADLTSQRETAHHFQSSYGSDKRKISMDGKIKVLDISGNIGWAIALVLRI